jgi:hypothetical protein
MNGGYVGGKYCTVCKRFIRGGVKCYTCDICTVCKRFIRSSGGKCYTCGGEMKTKGSLTDTLGKKTCINK